MHGFGNIFCEQKLFSMKFRIKKEVDGFGKVTYFPEYIYMGLWMDVDEYCFNTLKEAENAIGDFKKRNFKPSITYIPYD
jgi:hypothetical protein